MALKSSSPIVSLVVSRESEPASFLSSEYNYDMPIYRESNKKSGFWQEYSLNLLKASLFCLNMCFNF